MHILLRGIPYSGKHTLARDIETYAQTTTLPLTASCDTSDREPDMTIVLDLPPEIACERAAHNNKVAAQALLSLHKARFAYLHAADICKQYEIVDARNPRDRVWSDVKTCVDRALLQPIFQIHTSRYPALFLYKMFMNTSWNVPYS